MPGTSGYHHIRVHLSYQDQFADVDKDEKELTFRDGKEGDGYNRIPMSASDGVVRVANRQVEWVVLYMPSRHRDCGLIAPKDNGAVHRTFGSWVGCKDIILYAAL